MSDDVLGRAVTGAVERHGYGWVVGALEGCVRFGWDAQRVADYLLAEPAQDRSAGGDQTG